MPRIVAIPPSDTNTATVQLEKEGIVIDERVIGWDKRGYESECVIEGTTLTVTRIDINRGWRFGIYFRGYDPAIEEVPDFTSKSYRYHGLENERAPYDVEEVIVDASVTVIRGKAFHYCKMMKRCIMGDSVKRIEVGAFCNCTKMKNIRLSRTLRYIGESAFAGCESIECLFVPPIVEDIQNGAFDGCKNMKILVLPAMINLQRVGDKVVRHCPKLLNDTVQYQEIEYRTRNNRQVNRHLKHRYDHLPLIRLCTDPNSTAQMIRDFMQVNGMADFHQADDDHGLLPLHILTRYNPYIGKDAIVACFDVNPAALFIHDLDGNTPLDYLWGNEYGKIDVIFHLMQDLCINRLSDTNGSS